MFHNIYLSVVVHDQLQNSRVSVACQISRLCSFVQLTDDPDMASAAVLSNFLEACVWSLTQWDFLSVEEAIRTFRFNVRIVSIFSFRIRFFLRELLLMSCLGQPMCGGPQRGFCSNAWCLCESGYHFLVSAVSSSTNLLHIFNE